MEIYKVMLENRKTKNMVEGEVNLLLSTKIQLNNLN
ncbi:hypothetical protein LCGC14_1696010 [marine sediment metagenome]|uniref:Uncharacterized protein n=1 Tax=marine sediment metagenome TaxID=412755 RepID=A0A0F9E8G2_9ZZZZ